MNISCQQQVNKFYPPKNKFIKYEESDYEWLKYFGLGEYKKETDTILFKDALIRTFNYNYNAGDYTTVNIEFIAKENV